MKSQGPRTNFSPLYSSSCNKHTVWKSVANALRGTRIQVWKSVDSKCLCAASRGHRAALQLGGGWMVSQMASSLRGTRARIHVWIPSVSVLFVVALCLCTLVASIRDDSIGLLFMPIACALVCAGCRGMARSGSHSYSNTATATALQQKQVSQEFEQS